MPGRKPKPTELKIVQGTLRKDRSNPHEPKPVGNLLDAPAGFNDVQREVWDYAIANAPAGLLKRLDLSVLEVWVVACVFHREAAAKVVEQGQVISSPTGYPVVNPYLSNMNRQAVIMLKAAAEMGFTPSSRSKVKVEDTVQDENPFAKFANGG